MASLWRRTAARMLITGYTLTLRRPNEYGENFPAAKTTVQVKFGLEDYLGAEVRETTGGRWTLVLFHGIMKVDTQVKPSEAAVRVYCTRWMKGKLAALRKQYQQAEQWATADAVARGYKVEGMVMP